MTYCVTCRTGEPSCGLVCGCDCHVDGGGYAGFGHLVELRDGPVLVTGLKAPDGAELVRVPVYDVTEWWG